MGRKQKQVLSLRKKVSCKIGVCGNVYNTHYKCVLF